MFISGKAYWKICNMIFFLMFLLLEVVEFLLFVYFNGIFYNIVFPLKVLVNKLKICY